MAVSPAVWIEELFPVSQHQPGARARLRLGGREKSLIISETVFMSCCLYLLSLRRAVGVIVLLLRSRGF